MLPQASMSLILAAALMHPLGVHGREVGGTGLSLLPPHSHPTFSAGSLPYYCRSKNQHRSAISRVDSSLQKNKDHISLKVLISNLSLFMLLLYHSGNLERHMQCEKMKPEGKGR